MSSDSDGKSKTHHIQKQRFERKVDRTDGLILQIHHTMPEPTGGNRRTRFIYSCFSSVDHLLSIADHRGNVFIVDLNNNMFWLLGTYESVSLLSFHSHDQDELLIGCLSNIILLNADSGKECGVLEGHTEPPTQISYSNDGFHCLSISPKEGFIWDLRTLTQAHRLTLHPGMQIKKAMFMPASNNILGCFQDDAIHVWSFESFQCIKQIVPETWTGQNIRSIAFTRNGRAMVVGGLSQQLVVFIVDDWSSQKVVELPNSISGVKHIEFVPGLFEAGSNKVLGILSSSNCLHFLDITTGNLVDCKVITGIRFFTCSKGGNYIACNAMTGEVKLFNSEQLLLNKDSSKSKPFTKFQEASMEDRDTDVEVVSNEDERKPPRQMTISKIPHSKPPQRKQFNKEVESILNISRLQRILREFSEYPAKYRPLIWRTILKLPGNKQPWSSLAKRPLHPVAKNISKTYDLQNKIAFKCLQSVVSCLAYWSPIFAELPYLPLLVFPFIKVFHSDAFISFEAAATIIVNWCQHWFEYSAFPPVNVLGMVENVLAEHDASLLSLFYKNKVTSKVYAWSLLCTAFSEVLSSENWQQFWDHVLSNPPEFLLFAVVSYNLCCKASLKTCANLEDFTFFFSNQNPINMKQFINKCYELMENTSSENHPKQYLQPFVPLTQGNYPVFTAFPKFIVDYQRNQRGAILLEEEKILKDQRDLLVQRLAEEERRLCEKKAREEEARLIEAERAAHAALNAEEARLAERRKQLTDLRKNIRLQEKESIAKTRLGLLEQRTRQQCAQLDRIYRQLDFNGVASDLQAQEITEDYVHSLSHKEKLEQQVESERLKQNSEIWKQSQNDHRHLGLQKEKELLSRELHEYWAGRKPIDVATVVENVEQKYNEQQKHLDLAIKAKRNLDLLSGTVPVDEVQTIDAESRVNRLENEIQELMGRLQSCIETSSKDEITSRPTLKTSSGPTHSAKENNLPARNLSFYDEEKCAVAAATEIRKKLLQDWNRR